MKGKIILVSDKFLSKSLFLLGGFSNWKDADRCFMRHKVSGLDKRQLISIMHDCDPTKKLKKYKYIPYS